MIGGFRQRFDRGGRGEIIVRLASIFTQLFTCGAHVEYTYFPEIRAGFERGHYGFTIVGHHLQPAPVHDVHLLAHLPCKRKGRPNERVCRVRTPD